LKKIIEKKKKNPKVESLSIYIFGAKRGIYVCSPTISQDSLKITLVPIKVNLGMSSKGLKMHLAFKKLV
jgi:hypothetical protein